MLKLTDVIRRGLRADPILQAAVGEDADGEYKVYSTVGKTDAQAPFVVVTLVPDVGPLPVYGEVEAEEVFGVMVSSWAESSTEAWALADFADDAMVHADFDFTPSYLMLLRRDQTPQELPDPTTNWRQVIVRYVIHLGR